MSERRQIDLNSPDLEDQVIDTGEEMDGTPPVEDVGGAAGTGKTWAMRKRIEDDPAAGILCATTGIAAVNLGTTTINSVLGFFDTASLEDCYAEGKLTSRLRNLAQHYRSIIIDEKSMLDARQLDILYRAVTEINKYRTVPQPFGITLVGDFMQLPPVNAPFAFEAECWAAFAAAQVRLEKNWRQGDGGFLDALNSLRAGRGVEAAEMLPANCYARALDPKFDGTTIMGKNVEVDRYNWLRFTELKGATVKYKARRWGLESGGWKDIPEELPIRDGALVMILANDTERDEVTRKPLMRWVNGDCGHVVECSAFNVEVKLIRTGETVRIGMLERRTETKHPPEGATDVEISEAQDFPGSKLRDGSFWETKPRKRWIRGGITYMPLRHAWATTCHKSQGLSLDRIQVDLRGAFMGMPAMSYVALSRVRTVEGLRLVGDRGILGRRAKVDERVLPWL